MHLFCHFPNNIIIISQLCFQLASIISQYTSLVIYLCLRLATGQFNRNFGELQSKHLTELNLKSNRHIRMGTYLKRVIFISVICMCFEAISNSDLGIISQLASQNGNKWVGPLSISLIFLGSGLGACYNKYINRWPYKYVIFSGAMGWNIYISFSVMFLFIGFSNTLIAVILLGSLLCGFIVSVFYIGINNYVNDCGKIDRKVGPYFGINICIVQCSNILGSAISAAMIQPLGQKTYSLVMMGLSIAVSCSFLFVLDLNQAKTDTMIQQATEVQTPKQHSKIPIIFFLCFALSGIIISFVYSQFSLLFYQYFDSMEHQALNRLTFIAFMVEGCGQFVGGLSIAYFSDKLKSTSFVYVINGFFFLLSVAVLWVGFTQKQMWIVLIGSFMVGYADCFCFASALTLGGKWNASGISLFNFAQSVTVAVMSGLNIFLPLPYLFIIYSLVQVLSTAVLFSYRKELSSSRMEVPGNDY